MGETTKLNWLAGFLPSTVPWAKYSPNELPGWGEIFFSNYTTIGISAPFTIIVVG